MSSHSGPFSNVLLQLSWNPFRFWKGSEVSLGAFSSPGEHFSSQLSISLCSLYPQSSSASHPKTITKSQAGPGAGRGGARSWERRGQEGTGPHPFPSTQPSSVRNAGTGTGPLGPVGPELLQTEGHLNTCKVIVPKPTASSGQCH